MIPDIVSENCPESHPKNTGWPALIILMTAALRSSISAFTSNYFVSEEASRLEEENVHRTGLPPQRFPILSTE